MILRDSLFSQYQYLKNKATNFSANISVQVRIILISAPRQSVIAMIQLNLSSSERGPTKSIAIQSPQAYGTGRRYKSSIGEVMEDLFHWHNLQEGIYMVSISLRMLDQ